MLPPTIVQPKISELLSSLLTKANILWPIVIPRTCARGKVIGGVVVVVVVVHKKIARSWDLGTSATRKYNESVEIGEKLASGCLESSGMAYKLH